MKMIKLNKNKMKTKKAVLKAVLMMNLFNQRIINE